MCILTSRQASQLALSSQFSKSTRSSIQRWTWKITRPTLASAQWLPTAYIPIACQLPLTNRILQPSCQSRFLNLHISQALLPWVYVSLHKPGLGGEAAAVFSHNGYGQRWGISEAAQSRSSISVSWHPHSFPFFVSCLFLRKQVFNFSHLVVAIRSVGWVLLNSIYGNPLD
jgi:hypothetical protein